MSNCRADDVHHDHARANGFPQDEHARVNASTRLNDQECANAYAADRCANARECERLSNECVNARVLSSVRLAKQRNFQV